MSCITLIYHYLISAIFTNFETQCFKSFYPSLPSLCLRNFLRFVQLVRCRPSGIWKENTLSRFIHLAREMDGDGGTFINVLMVYLMIPSWWITWRITIPAQLQDTVKFQEVIVKIYCWKNGEDWRHPFCSPITSYLSSSQAQSKRARQRLLSDLSRFPKLQ